MTTRRIRTLSVAAATVATGLALGAALPAAAVAPAPSASTTASAPKPAATTKPPTKPVPTATKPAATTKPAVPAKPAAAAPAKPAATPKPVAPAKPTATPKPSASVRPTASPKPVVAVKTPVPAPTRGVAPGPTGSPTATTPVPPTPTPSPTRVRLVPPPTALQLNKTIGHSANSRTVLLTGTGFTDLAGVQVGGSPVSNLVVLSPTVARFVLPNALDYQAKVATLALVSREDGLVRPTAVTFTYKVANRLDRQMAYAFQHWNVRANAAFGYLSGSDCANFASQTLLARGWTRTKDWFNYGAGRWSGTWVSSTAMSTWLKKRPDLATHLAYRERDAVTVGDIVQFRWAGHPKTYTAWDHTGIVSKVVVLPNGRHDVYYVSHTNDRQYGGSTGMFAKYMGASLRIQFFHLTG